MVRNSEVKYWLELVERLLNKHLQELVSYVDVDNERRNKTYAVKVIEDENQELREENTKLKSTIRDLQIELEGYKLSLQNFGCKEIPNLIGSTSALQESSNGIIPTPVLSASNSSVTTTAPRIFKEEDDKINQLAESFLDRYSKAKKIILDLKEMETSTKDLVVSLHPSTEATPFLKTSSISALSSSTSNIEKNTSETICDVIVPLINQVS
jgi:hypothetical protein